MPKKIDQQTLIQSVLKFSKDHCDGRTPKFEEFNKYQKGLHYRLKVCFEGKFSNLLDAAGFNQNIRNESSSLITPPNFEDDDLTAEEIIEQQCKLFDKKKAFEVAQKWMTFKVHDDRPIAINWFGDPHVDDDGCNWPLLLKHIDIIKKTEGMFGANIGDTHNNWVGRLGQLYANQEMSRGRALKLAKWFVQDSGVDWLIWLIGNHDKWNYGSDVLKEYVRHYCVLKDWRAQFKLQFKNKREVLIDAAHNHAGHSQWNALHGQQKASSMGGVAHLYIGGHLHNWALAHHECPHTNRVYWLARARGYKHIDEYAENLGFGNQTNGSSIVTVIDPKGSDINLVRCFADVEEGADYLKFRRMKAGC